MTDYQLSEIIRPRFVQTLINKNQSLQNIDKTHAVLKIRKLKAANIYVCGLCHYLHKIYVISISIITEYILNTFLQNSGPGRGLLLGVLLPLLRLKISKDWNHETRTRCTGRRTSAQKHTDKTRHAELTSNLGFPNVKGM